MKTAKKNSTDNWKTFGKRWPLPHAGMANRRADDMVERLFGKMTHLSFVVELGAKGWRERKRS